MSAVFSSEEELLLKLLDAALKNEKFTNAENNVRDADLLSVVSYARKHAVTSFLYETIKDNLLFEKAFTQVELESRRTVMQSYRLLFLTKYVVNLLEQHGIKAIVLKGVATASMYSVPELRKSGDVDLLIPDNVSNKLLTDIMKKADFRVAQEQHANHHLIFVTPEGIHIELHVMLSEPLAYKKINFAANKYLKDCWTHIQVKEIMGVCLPILDNPYHAYELLLHMMQHFLYAGFGLKLLCDWVVLWRQKWSKSEQTLFVEMIEESGLKRFAEIITAICIKYLGFEASRYPYAVTVDETAEELLCEVIAAEDMGNSDTNRMVMMSGTGLWAYVREFHHQMHLNFPKAGKCFLLWPVLWVITLVKFLINNRKVRNVSTGSVLKEAKRRSKLMDKLKLFE